MLTDMQVRETRMLTAMLVRETRMLTAMLVRDNDADCHAGERQGC